MEPGLDRLPGLMHLTRRQPRASLRWLRSALVALAAVVVVTSLGGCAGQEQSGSPAQRVSSWMNAGGGGSGIGNVDVASRNVDLALARHNVPSAIKEVCALLSNEAQTGIGNLPTPDDQLTTELNAAYEDATAAGNDCFHGADGDRTLMARSAAERTRLIGLLDAVVAHVKRITGKTPTTETTAPQSGGDPFGGGS